MKMKNIEEKAEEIKRKSFEITKVSMFNVFKRQTMKFKISTGINSLNKSLYNWENEYQISGIPVDRFL